MRGIRRRADFIFHDPFSPDVNPELWTGEVFSKLLAWSAPSAVLATYCAASAARGAMCWAGWKVARAPGALGKREMSLASPDASMLEGFERVNEERLAARYEAGDF
ncbi:MAG: MnmC family methyltransferase [Balneolaceae bacterium]|nr:MnmC family methyltransferase [Balneolaceae bacterium]